MYLGRFRLGDWIPFQQITRDSSYVPETPDTVPEIYIYQTDGTRVTGADGCFPFQLNVQTGLFQLKVQANADPATDFAVGHYVAHIGWRTVALDASSVLNRFEIVGGGHLSGAYQQIHEYNNPQARYIVGHTDADILEFRKNPRV